MKERYIVEKYKDTGSLPVSLNRAARTAKKNACCVVFKRKIKKKNGKYSHRIYAVLPDGENCVSMPAYRKDELLSVINCVNTIAFVKKNPTAYKG